MVEVRGVHAAGERSVEGEQGRLEITRAEQRAPQAPPRVRHGGGEPRGLAEPGDRLVHAVDLEEDLAERREDLGVARVEARGLSKASRRVRGWPGDRRPGMRAEGRASCSSRSASRARSALARSSSSPPPHDARSAAASKRAVEAGADLEVEARLGVRRLHMVRRRIPGPGGRTAPGRRRRGV